MGTTRAITAYLGMGATAIVAYLLLPEVPGSIVWMVLATSTPIAIVVGVRRYRPPRPLPWYLLSVGLATYVVGDVLWILLSSDDSLGPGDAAYLLAYPVVALACLMMSRTDGRTSFLAMTDALIGALGLAVIVWDIVLSKGVEGTGPTLASIVNASYPVFDILILTLLLRLALAGGSHPPAYWWLVGGFSLLLATDLAYIWMQRTAVDPSSPFLDLGWLSSYVAIGAAALHPSMAHLTHRGAPDAALSPGRIVWLGTPLFLVPILILLAGRDQPIDVIIQGTASVGIAALIMVRIVLSAKDQARAHHAARIAEVEYRAVFESSPVAILKVTTAGTILEANPAAERLFAFDGGLVDETSAGLLVDPEADTPRIREAWMALAAEPSTAHATWTARVRRGDGSSFWSTANASIVRDFDGAISFSIIAMEDVTLQREEEEHLRFRALHDPLTGLPNRDLLSEGMRRSLARAKRQGSKVAVMFMDLDGFKSVNDRFGHAVGDELLRALAERLEAAARGGDVVARLGGDEFVIVVDGVQSIQQAEATALRFLEEVRRPVVAAGTRITLQASIGLVVAGADDLDPDEILRHADSAMYEAKREGSGGWRRFEHHAAAGL